MIVAIKVSLSDYASSTDGEDGEEKDGETEQASAKCILVTGSLPECLRGGGV
jgi:hypothetical protein